MVGGVHLFALLPTTVHFRLRWTSYTCDFSCYNIKFHLLMPYVICVITNVPFLAHKALNEFIWNNFYPNTAKHLTNRFQNVLSGVLFDYSVWVSKQLRVQSGGEKERRERAGAQRLAWEALGKRRLWFPSFPASPFLPFRSSPSSPIPFSSIILSACKHNKGGHQIKQGIIYLRFCY